MAEENPFRKFWKLGYRRLVPIIPPGARISPNSLVAKKPGAVGKIPGIRKADGTWRSFNWMGHETIEEDLDVWFRMGAGVGVRTGQGLGALDVDVATKDRLAIVMDVLRERGIIKSAYRVGRKPRFLIPFRVAGPEFRSKSPILYEDDGERVEVLYEGRQFVAFGEHPATGKPYEWPRGVPDFHDLPAL